MDALLLFPDSLSCFIFLEDTSAHLSEDEDWQERGKEDRSRQADDFRRTEKNRETQAWHLSSRRSWSENSPELLKVPVGGFASTLKWHWVKSFLSCVVLCLPLFEAKLRNLLILGFNAHFCSYPSPRRLAALCCYRSELEGNLQDYCALWSRRDVCPPGEWAHWLHLGVVLFSFLVLDLVLLFPGLHLFCCRACGSRPPSPTPSCFMQQVPPSKWTNGWQDSGRGHHIRGGAYCLAAQFLPI